MRYPFGLLCLMAISSAAASATPGDQSLAASLLTETAGRWQGELQYRDYQSNTWQGLPMTVAVTAQPDQVTTIRTAQYDDGPQTGIVTITTTTLVDPVAATLSYAIFRKSRATDVGLSHLIEAKLGADRTHWTIVTIEMRKDGTDAAQVRETTTRDGDTMTTLKEVNPVDDGKDVWLPRNRSVLHRVGS